MKKIHPSISVFAAIIFSLLLSPALRSQNCNYSWVSQNSGTLNVFYTVKAVNDQVCWTGGASAIVLRTINGGINWLNANPNPGVINGQVNNIDAIDGNIAWVTTTNGGGTFIYRTSNGGMNWQQVYSSSQTRIFGLKMTDAVNGFAFGDPISNIWQLLITSNGGLNWSLSPNAPSAQAIETCLPNSFYVSLPNIWWGTSITTIYRSSNSGINWSSHAANVSGIYIQSIHYNSPSLGLSGSITMSKSTNGGLNYAGLPAPGAGNIEGIEGEGNNFWYVRSQQVYHSTDAGETWQSVHTASQSLNHIDFPDGISGCQTGWVVGFGGVISKLIPGPTGINRINNQVPEKFTLEQNYPNPFNPNTTVNFSIPHNGYTVLRIFDITGNEISVPVKQDLQAGNYSVNIALNDLASGIYLYTLTSGNFKDTKRMVLIK